MSDAPGPISPKLLGVVLNGGKSSRMGKSKASLKHSDGHSFLDHAIEQLRHLCLDIVISTAKDSPEKTLGNHFNTISDENESLGPLAGISTCLRHAATKHFQACIFLPIDTPEIMHEDLTRLRDQWIIDTTKPVCALHGKTNQLEPLISIIPTSLARSAVKSVIQHELAVHKWMYQNHVSTVLFERSKLANINHPCEYKKLLGCDTDF